MKATADKVPLADAPPPTPAGAEEYAAPRGTAGKAAVHGGGRARSAPERGGSDAAAPASNLDQIRDIIFGGQMREYDRRFVRLEERLLKEVGDVREELRQRLAVLERYVRDEVESLTVELRTEQQSRTAEDRRLTQSITDTAKAAEERLTASGEQTAKQHRELRAQVLDQARTLADEAQRRQAELTALVERETLELRSDKTDRVALADLFTEVALRLRGEFSLPNQ